MTDAIKWDDLFGKQRDLWRPGIRPADFEPSQLVLEHVDKPTEADTRWLTEALRSGSDPADGRKWFVAHLCGRSNSWADVFFAPMLDAAIDEIDPSYNKSFVEPCMNRFGARRVNEYLLAVVESGTDFRRAGAVNALYWAQVPLTFPSGAPSYDIEHATSDSRALYESLGDIWERKKRLLLETFVTNVSVDVRRSIIPSLDLDPLNYPESHRPVVDRAVQIARSHEDEYVRHRVEVQLGETRGMLPLPHRAAINLKERLKKLLHFGS